MSASILSPAKINLMLRIIGQRADGYHLLQTYFQLLNWGDSMCFDLINSDKIEIHGDFQGLAVENNLIYKAARLLLPFRKKTDGICIHVEKKIPQGSGLGGGSSNAGTCLRILNNLWQCELSQQQLQKLGLTLGADVPIFVLNQSAMATGIGEQLTPLQVKKYYYVLIFPKTSIATADIFSEKKLVRNQQLIENIKIHDKNYWTNACLPIVLHKFPELKEIYTMTSQFSKIYLSGTGSTLYACFSDKNEAIIFQKKCPENIKTILCEAK